MRNLFYWSTTLLILAIGVLGWFRPVVLWSYAVVIPLFILGVQNSLQQTHTILRNFPLIGYLRYFFEFISPEIQQYFIERHTDGRPFSRQSRALVYRRAKNVSDTTPFGTQLDINAMEYEGLRHSMYPAPVHEHPPRVVIGGPHCTRPYSASLLNVSAMSFGSLSSNATLALNAGAKKGGFYQNTGEGGLTEYHLRHGGDVTWQVGTGYFGCRNKDGTFNAEKFKENASHEHVKMIELKLSQGAKPGHGGVLPASKNTKEIAKFRGIDPHTDVLSPPAHSAFANARGMVEFIQQLRDLSDGKPIGIKLCIGHTDEFRELCRVMRAMENGPDFIVVDGAEGGTGAAPLEFVDSVGMPLEPALIFVHRTLASHGLRERVKVIASGKVITAVSVLKLLAMGADLCNSARGFMFSVGCIQALRCNTNNCPTGVATQDPELAKGLAVPEKGERAYHFHKNTVKAVMELLAAAGKHDISEVSMDMFLRGDEFVALENRYFPDGLSEVDSDPRNR